MTMMNDNMLLFLNKHLGIFYTGVGTQADYLLLLNINFLKNIFVDAAANFNFYVDDTFNILSDKG